MRPFHRKTVSQQINRSSRFSHRFLNVGKEEENDDDTVKW